MLGVFIPEVERAVATGGAKCTLRWVEVDAVDGIAVGCVGGSIGVVLAVALEREVCTAIDVSMFSKNLS